MTRSKTPRARLRLSESEEAHNRRWRTHGEYAARQDNQPHVHSGMVDTSATYLVVAATVVWWLRRIHDAALRLLRTSRLSRVYRSATPSLIDMYLNCTSHPIRTSFTPLFSLQLIVSKNSYVS